MPATSRGARTILAAVAVGIFFQVGATADASESQRSPELATRLLLQYQLSDTRFAPDGSRAAFVAREPIQGKELKSSIWLYDAKADAVRQLTTAGQRDSQPRWSPDNATLAFLSKRSGQETQIYLLPSGGGEARRLTEAKSGIRSFEWAPVGGRIAYLGTDAPLESPNKDKGDDASVGSAEYPPTRLTVIEIASGATRAVMPSKDWAVAQFAWLPDGRHVAVTATDRYLPEGTIDRLFVVSLDDGTMREVGHIEGVEYANLEVSPDGKFLAYVGSSHGPTSHDLFVQPLAGGPARNLTGAASAAAIDRPVADVAWSGVRELTFTTQDGFGNTIRSVRVEGASKVLKTFSDEQISALAMTSGKLLYAKSDQISPPELWLSSGGADRKVSSFHRPFPGLLRPELIRYSSSDGYQIEAALYRPVGTQGRVPLVVLVHGGPTGRWGHQITNWAQLLAANGFAVLAPNVRGSVGYGEAFLMSNKADWGGGDFRDVMAGVDHLIQDGLADPERLAIAGWSYGGFMSAWAITQTQRFKAAVIGAAMLDLNVQWGAESPDLVAYDSWYIGTPWENPENFRRMSPLTHVTNVKTPSLLLVGEQDTVDHPAQHWQFYRALRMKGVESELVVYPREGHGIKEELHARDVMNRMVDWIASHLR